MLPRLAQMLVSQLDSDLPWLGAPGPCRMPDFAVCGNGVVYDTEGRQRATRRERLLLIWQRLMKE